MADPDRTFLTSSPTLILLLSVLLALSGCQSDGSDGTQIVQIGDETFELELALTQAARYRGLSGRESIPADGGMLFVFPSEAERAFVMRDCLVPIDILFLGPSGRVMTTHAMQVEPMASRKNPSKQYPSRGRSALVIELAGGTIERLGVEPGDQIELPILELKRRTR